MATKFETAISLIEKEEETLNIFSFLFEDIAYKKMNLFKVTDDKLLIKNEVDKKIRGYLFQAIENMQREVLEEAMSVYKRQLVDACREAEEEANEVLRRVRCFEVDKEANEVLNRIRKSDKNIQKGEKT